MFTCHKHTVESPVASCLEPSFLRSCDHMAACFRSLSSCTKKGNIQEIEEEEMKKAIVDLQPHLPQSCK